MAEHISETINQIQFGQLFNQYKPRFVTIAHSYVRDEMVAEDIVSDCFASFWENREKLPADVNAPAYIMTSVKNRCLNWLREKAIHLRVEQTIYSTRMRVMATNIRSLDICDPECLFTDEISRIVEEALASMPELTRSVFISNRYKDKTYNDIAHEYDISLRRVEYEIQKAVKILRESLKDYLPILIMFLVINKII